MLGHRTSDIRHRTTDIGHRTRKWFYILSNAAIHSIGQTIKVFDYSRSSNFYIPCARLNWQFSVSFQVHVKSSSSYRIIWYFCVVASRIVDYILLVGGTNDVIIP